MSDAHAGATGDHAPVGPGARTHVDDPHGATDHGADHGHDDHGHAEEPLAPMDWGMWGTGVLGVVLGLVVAWLLVLVTGTTLIGG